MKTAEITETLKCGISFDRPEDDTLLIRITGNCRIGDELPSVDEIQEQVGSDSRIKRLTFDMKDLAGWDSGFLTFLNKVFDQCSQDRIDVEKEGLPQGVQRLLELAAAVPERKGARKESVRAPFLEQAGQAAIDLWDSTLEIVGLI